MLHSEAVFRIRAPRGGQAGEKIHNTFSLVKDVFLLVFHGILSQKAVVSWFARSSSIPRIAGCIYVRKEGERSNDRNFPLFGQEEEEGTFFFLSVYLEL